MTLLCRRTRRLSLLLVREVSDDVDLREALPVQVFSPAHDGEALSIATVHREDGTLFATGGTDQ